MKGTYKKQRADKTANRSSESHRFESIHEPGQAVAYGPSPQMLYIYIQVLDTNTQYHQLDTIWQM